MTCPTASVVVPVPTTAVEPFVTLAVPAIEAVNAPRRPPVSVGPVFGGATSNDNAVVLPAEPRRGRGSFVTV